MSILYDCNQFLIGSMLVCENLGQDVDLELIRKLFVKQINQYAIRFSQYGSPILCFDNQVYWRKQKFPHYKHNRKNDRKKSKTDWSKIFTDINSIKDKLIDGVYPVLDVHGAEADDLIACIAKHENSINQNTMIISGDKDFIQLLIYDNVSIYNHQKKILLVGETGYERRML
jgi:5'-3' exonuclease